jgi:hypothetical protein
MGAAAATYCGHSTNVPAQVLPAERLHGDETPAPVLPSTRRARSTKRIDAIFESSAKSMAARIEQREVARMG